MFHWLWQLLCGVWPTQPTVRGRVGCSGEQLKRDDFQPPRETRIGDTEPAVVIQFKWTRTERRSPVETCSKSAIKESECVEETHSDSPAVLELSGSYFAWAVNQREEWYSPCERRIYYRCAGETDWKACSLLAVVSFRVAESYNRDQIGDVLSTILEKPTAFSTGSSLSIQVPSIEGEPIPTIAVETVLYGDIIEFRHEGLVWVTLEWSEHDIPSRCRDSWRLFLTHCCQIHPAIREQILKSPRVPRWFSYHMRDVGGESETRLTFIAMSEREPKREWPIKFGFAVSPSAIPALNGCLEALADRTPATPYESFVRTRDLCRDFADQGLGVDCLLSDCEFWLTTGLKHVLELDELTDSAVRSDVNARKLIEHFRARSPEALDAAIKYYDSLDRSALRTGYLLDFLTASARQNMGRTEDIEQLFLNVLAVNPELAGVWCELGKHYYFGFRHEDAWHCFDAAKRIAPSNPLLADILVNEAKLLHDFKDYF